MFLHSAFRILHYGRDMGLQAYLILAAVVFGIGLFGVVTRRNTIGILLGSEIGMVFTVFAICITVAEAAMGLAIVILLFRIRRTVMADHLDLLKG